MFDAFSTTIEPSIMVSKTWGDLPYRNGGTLEALNRTLDTGLFEGFQILEVQSKREREAIGRLIHERGCRLNYALSEFIYGSDINVSSTNETIRRRGVDILAARIDHAREVNACFVQILSGRRPERPEDRPDAVKRLTESMLELCEVASQPPEVGVLIEPLDIDADKKGSLGTADEAVVLMRSLASEGHRAWLILDSAHLRLKEEETAPVGDGLPEWVAEYHLCNCVVEKAHPLYGDRHIPFGLPGFLDEKKAGDILNDLHRRGYLREKSRLRIFPEVEFASDLDPIEAMKILSRFIRDAHAYALSRIDEGTEDVD